MLAQSGAIRRSPGPRRLGRPGADPAV